MLLNSFFICLLGSLVRFGDATGEAAWCYAPVDIVQVQDMTSSFDHLWDGMARQIPDVVKTIKTINPSSLYGFTTFGDKPLSGKDQNGAEHKLGYKSDYCFKVDISLSMPDPEKMQKLFETYSKKAQGGGGDWPEASLEGVYRAALSSKVGWRKKERDLSNSTRVIVMVTDAMPHEYGDVKQLVSIDLPDNSLTSSDLKEKENAKCSDYEYPTVKQVADALKETETQLLVLAAPAGYYNGTTGKFEAYDTIWYKGAKYRDYDGLSLWFHDIFADEGIEIFTTPVDSEMTEYAEAFERVLNSFQAYRCATTTTTSEPTTTFATTEGEQLPDDVDEPTTAQPTHDEPFTFSTTTTTATTTTGVITHDNPFTDTTYPTTTTTTTGVITHDNPFTDTTYPTTTTTTTTTPSTAPPTHGDYFTESTATAQSTYGETTTTTTTAVPTHGDPRPTSITTTPSTSSAIATPEIPTSPSTTTTTPVPTHGDPQPTTITTTTSTSPPSILTTTIPPTTSTTTTTAITSYAVESTALAQSTVTGDDCPNTGNTDGNVTTGAECEDSGCGCGCGCNMGGGCGGNMGGGCGGNMGGCGGNMGGGCGGNMGGGCGGNMGGGCGGSGEGGCDHTGSGEVECGQTGTGETVCGGNSGCDCQTGCDQDGCHQSGCGCGGNKVQVVVVIGDGQ